MTMATQFTREELLQTHTFKTVRRPGLEADLADGVDFNIFNVAGIVLVSHMFGIVTTVIGAGVAVPFIEITTVVPAATVALCAAHAGINASAVDTMFGWDGLVATALTSSAVGSMELAAGNTWTGGFYVLTDGVINIDNAIVSTGIIDWYITYIPMSTDGEVTVL